MCRKIILARDSEEKKGRAREREKEKLKEREEGGGKWVKEKRGERKRETACGKKIKNVGVCL